MLAWTIYISFLGALAAWLAGPNRPHVVRSMALGASVLTLLLAFLGSSVLDHGTVTTLVKSRWIPSLGHAPQP